METAKQFYQYTLLLFSIMMFISIRLSSNIYPTVVTNEYTMNYNMNNTQSSQPTQVNIWSINQCWTHLFVHLFVESELDHRFMNPNVDKSTNLITHCDISNTKHIDMLLNDTLHTLQALNTSSGFTFHDAVSLRRSIMLVAQHLNITNHNIYTHILQWTSSAEASYRRFVRYKYPIFNIHLPRSAGTSICYLFRLASSYQDKEPLSTGRKIRTDPDAQNNCNIGDGFPFYQYLINSHAPKTCTEQYHMASGHNMFARESPLYPNHNESISHPGLCNGFVYMLSVRSPIERILSWLRMDALFIANEQHIELSAFITGFFSSLFDYDLNPPFVDEILVRKSDGTHDKIRSYNQWIRGYANNALTRWIGYEFAPRDIQNNELMKGLLAHKEIINKNDIHFYNAIQLMLRVDYVLNFASYGRDDSTANAIKYTVNNTRKYKQFERLLLSDVTKIIDVNNNDSVWNMLVTHLNEHYETNLFDWNRTARDGGFVQPKNEIFNLLTASDWKTLYEENYFDFRLYALAKHIGRIDVEYHHV